jgi:hypothetical protein
VGKWGNNNGQACIAPDYILAEDSIAPRVVNRYIGSTPSPWLFEEMFCAIFPFWNEFFLPTKSP